jgi:hypothetical protein
MALSKEQVLKNWYEISKYMPVNWKDKESIKKFKLACESYSKPWDKLDYESQGWVSEQIMEGRLVGD